MGAPLSFSSDVRNSKKLEWKRSKVVGLGQIEQLARRYADGESANALAAESGVHRGRLCRLLKERGVELRSKTRRLDEGQVSAASDLYRSGLSVREVAEAFGVGTETMRTNLTSAVLVLRRPRGSRSK